MALLYFNCRRFLLNIAVFGGPDYIGLHMANRRGEYA